MKSTKLLIVLFQLSAFLSLLHLPSSSAKDNGVPLLDVEGRQVLKGGRRGIYYMLPASELNGGGVTLARTKNETCPLTVVLSPNENSDGEPIGLDSGGNSRFIFQDTEVLIGFASPPKCARGYFLWTMDPQTPERSLGVFLTNRITPNSGWFVFKKASSEVPSYKLVFCRYEDPLDDKMLPWCYDVGIYRDQKGYTRLVATEDNPMLVVLKRVTKSTA